MLTPAFANTDQLGREQAGVRRFVCTPVCRADQLRAYADTLGFSGSEPDWCESEPAYAGTPLHGTVLSGEKNGVNRQAATAILTKLCLQFCPAKNGQEAVDFARELEFGDLLMGCRIAVMDEYRTTEAIWRPPKSHGERLPIITLSANAPRGDEQKCLDARVSDFRRSAPWSLNQIESAFVANDGNALSHADHPSKSSTVNVAAETLYGLYRQFESLEQESRVYESRTLLDQSWREHHRTVTHLRGILREAG
jgi:CheY-like chemotaxis protein